MCISIFFSIIKAQNVTVEVAHNTNLHFAFTHWSGCLKDPLYVTFLPISGGHKWTIPKAVKGLIILLLVSYSVHRVLMRPPDSEGRILPSFQKQFVLRESQHQAL